MNEVYISHSDLLCALRRHNPRYGNIVWLGYILHQSIRKKGKDWGKELFNGKRATPGRQSVDLCDLDARETVRATLSRDELTEWENRDLPLDGQRPGAEGAKPGSGVRFDPFGLPKTWGQLKRRKNESES
jgi:hypothetical protein